MNSNLNFFLPKYEHTVRPFKDVICPMVSFYSYIVITFNLIQLPEICVHIVYKVEKKNTTYNSSHTYVVISLYFWVEGIPLSAIPQQARMFVQSCQKSFSVYCNFALSKSLQLTIPGSSLTGVLEPREISRINKDPERQ